MWRYTGPALRQQSRKPLQNNAISMAKDAIKDGTWSFAFTKPRIAPERAPTRIATGNAAHDSHAIQAIAAYAPATAAREPCVISVPPIEATNIIPNAATMVAAD